MIIVDWIPTQEASNWIQFGVGVVLFLTLIGVLWYAREARRAANASIAMAKEMRGQRYSQFQPVVDIEPASLKNTGELQNVLVLNDGGLPDTVECVLRNVGVGPALDVEAYIETCGKHNSRLSSNEMGAIGNGVTKKVVFLSKNDVSGNDKGPNSYCASYYDLAGRLFVSRRKVTYELTGKPVLGRLEYNPPGENKND